MSVLRSVRSLLRRVFVPVCPGGCRQSVDRCACSWLPPLPEEIS